MSGKSLIDQIRHYQKDIERFPDNAERMIRCIKRLYVLPVAVEHLQETGVGRSVNSLRKYDGEVGDAAKALVAKWKAMVAAEELNEEVQNEIKNSVRQSTPVKEPSKSTKTDRDGPQREEHVSNGSHAKKRKHHRSDSSDCSPVRKIKKHCKKQSRKRDVQSSDSERERESDVSDSDQGEQSLRSSNDTSAESEKEESTRSEAESSSSDGSNRQREYSSSHSKNKNSHRSSRKSPSSKESNYSDLIKANELKVKKEKMDRCKEPRPKSAKANVKIERNEDGSIDQCSDLGREMLTARRDRPGKRSTFTSCGEVFCTSDPDSCPACNKKYIFGRGGHKCGSNGRNR